MKKKIQKQSNDNSTLQCMWYILEMLLNVTPLVYLLKCKTCRKAPYADKAKTKLIIKAQTGPIEKKHEVS